MACHMHSPIGGHNECQTSYKSVLSCSLRVTGSVIVAPAEYISHTVVCTDTEAYCTDARWTITADNQEPIHCTNMCPSHELVITCKPLSSPEHSNSMYMYWYNNNNNNKKGGHCECIATWRPSDVAPVVVGCFWPNFYCACTQTANSHLPIKILTSTLDSATPIC